MSTAVRVRLGVIALSEPFNRLNAVRMVPDNHIAAVFVNDRGDFLLLFVRLEGVLIAPVNRDNRQIGKFLRFTHLAGDKLAVEIRNIGLTPRRQL